MCSFLSKYISFDSAKIKLRIFSKVSFHITVLIPEISCASFLVSLFPSQIDISSLVSLMKRISLIFLSGKFGAKIKKVSS